MLSYSTMVSTKIFLHRGREQESLVEVFGVVMCYAVFEFGKENLFIGAS